MSNYVFKWREEIQWFAINFVAALALTYLSTSDQDLLSNPWPIIIAGCMGSLRIAVAASVRPLIASVLNRA